MNNLKTFEMIGQDQNFDSESLISLFLIVKQVHFLFKPIWLQSALSQT